MAEIYVNTNAPLKTKIFYGGEIVDADGTVTANIYDITQDPSIIPAIVPSTLIQSITATKSEVDMGSYYVNMPFSLTTRNKKLKIVWTYSVNSTTASHIAYLNIVTPYCNIDEAIEDLNIGTDPSDPNYKSYRDLQMAERWSRKVIENFTMQKFYKYDDKQTVYGSSSDILPLPFKLNELHKIYSNDILLIDNLNNVNNWIHTPMISETGFGVRVNRANLLDNTVYTANGMVPPTVNDYDGTGAFYKNVTYRVEGKFGYELVPDNVQQACIELMIDFFGKDKVWTNKYIKKIQTFDWNFEYSSGVYSGTGNNYADQLLYPYVLNGMVVI